MKLRKISALFVSALCLFCATGCDAVLGELSSVSALEPSKGLIFDISDDHTYASVESIGACKDSVVVIPDSYRGYPVKVVGGFAMRENGHVEKVIIPEGVTTIDDCCFQGCENLKEVVFPKSLVLIRAMAFEFCESLTKVVLPDGVSGIGDFAFAQCASLREVCIPAQLAYIGKAAFMCCESLTGFTVHKNNRLYEAIDGSLYDTALLGNNRELLQYALGKTDSAFAVPSDVRIISEYAFAGSRYLTNIHLPDSVMCIEEGAFAKCEALDKIIIPKNVSAIGAQAFMENAALTIYCRAQKQPSGWVETWNKANAPVVWGYTGE